jgi:hypothetical protein
MPTFELLHVRRGPRGPARGHRQTLSSPCAEPGHTLQPPVPVPYSSPNRDIHFTARRFKWGVGEWHHRCSSKGLNELSMGGERGQKAAPKQVQRHSIGRVAPMSAMPVRRRPHRNAAVRILPCRIGRKSRIGAGLDRLPDDPLSPNPGTGCLRHSVLGSKSVGMSMLGSIDGVLVRAATRVPSPFRSARLRRLPAGE